MNELPVELVPAFVNLNAPATGWQDNLDYNLGFFAQDRWTIDRLTLSGGVRVDFLNTSTEPFTLGPHRWLPNRNVTFAAVENVPNWKDVNPRVSVAYDLFGNGKTALKASASRGVEQESIGIARLNNPANTVATTHPADVGRRNNNFVPDCVLTNPLANGECGPNLNPNFGSAVPATRLQPRHHGGLGRAAVELGVLHQHPAADLAARLGDVRLLPAHQRQLLGHRQRGAQPDGLHAVFGDDPRRSAAARRRRRNLDGSLRSEHQPRRPQRREERGRRSASSSSSPTASI